MWSLLTSSFQRLSQYMEKKDEMHLISFGLLVRISVTLLMALSCHLIPDFYPGDEVDVARFYILQPSDKACLAWEGTVCSESYFEARTCRSTDQEEEVEQPLHPQPSNNNNNILQSTIYPILLEPLTRWDSARFLQLAHQPQIRTPHTETRFPLFRHDEDDKEALRMVDHNNDYNYNHNNDKYGPFAMSERSHAFLPLFPTLVRLVARGVLTTCIPSFLLPSNCQGVLVLSAWMFNTLCFVVAMRSLYHLTLRHSMIWMRRNGSWSDNNKKSNGGGGEQQLQQCRQWATWVVLLFIWNPAHVFFVASYSESLFAALVFTGLRFMLESEQQGGGRRRTIFKSLRASCSFVVGVVLWMTATYGRSNGTFYAGYLILRGAGKLLQPKQSIVQRLGSIVAHVVAAAVLFLPLVLHNQSGIDAHCALATKTGHEYDDGNNRRSRIPEWCNDRGSFFHLYPYVQRKYWNVGLFRYFEWEQLHNFLFAVPTLFVSSTAVVSWIVASWKRHSVSTTGLHRFWRARRLIAWAIVALQAYANHNGDNDCNSEVHPANNNNNNEDDVKTTGAGVTASSSAFFLSPAFLPDYALLAAASLLIFTTAHVQISTRLLCSSCPALYWYMASLLAPAAAPRVGGLNRRGEALLWYCAVYIALGVTMHPNWLPWT